MKLVQKSLTRSITVICALLALTVCGHSASASDPRASPEYLRYFNPSKGFKPAQTNLTQIFLQLAGSLEHSGSPEAYLRHMQKEHARISAKLTAKTGKPHHGRMPAHMTDAYVEKLIANWNLLSFPATSIWCQSRGQEDPREMLPSRHRRALGPSCRVLPAPMF